MQKLVRRVSEEALLGVFLGRAGSRGRMVGLVRRVGEEKMVQRVGLRCW